MRAYARIRERGEGGGSWVGPSTAGFAVTHDRRPAKHILFRQKPDTAISHPLGPAQPLPGSPGPGPGAQSLSGFVKGLLRNS